jgi:predicted nucleic acid-binding protein
MRAPSIRPTPRLPSPSSVSSFSYALLPVTDQIVERFARQRAALRRQGQLIPDIDLLIAATALEENLTLVTRNIRHFERIPELRLYQPS